MLTLEERCMSKLIEKIPKKNKGAFLSNYISQTPKNLHSKMIDEIISCIEKQISEYTTAMMAITVPYITNDIILTITTPGRDRLDYYKVFEDVSLYVIESSITIAEKLATLMENRYVENVQEAHERHYNSYYNSESDDEIEVDYDSY